MNVNLSQVIKKYQLVLKNCTSIRQISTQLEILDDVIGETNYEQSGKKIMLNNYAVNLLEDALIEYKQIKFKQTRDSRKN